ncbi:Ig kappa chain V region 3368 isoform X2 [Narcine bancroftii]|uniref:Ig kappa chain V region 3368 isoform X2 n=1 Tax=Narcine bancroftii TaxID=1343680 RepID=UPI003831F147
MAGPMFLCLPLMFFVTATEGKSDVSVVQSPRFQQAIKGESITINCEITFTQGNLLGTRFEKDSSSQVDLCYVSAKTKHIAEQYKNRLECDIGKEDGKAINITFSNLQVNDSGAYFCIAGVKNGRLLDVTGKGTFLIVSGADWLPNISLEIRETKRNSVVTRKKEVIIWRTLKGQVSSARHWSG